MKWWWAWVPVQLGNTEFPMLGYLAWTRHGKGACSWAGPGADLPTLSKAKRQHYSLKCCPALLRSFCTSRLPGQSASLLREGLEPWGPWSPGLPTGLAAHLAHPLLMLALGKVYDVYTVALCGSSSNRGVCLAVPGTATFSSYCTLSLLRYDRALALSIFKHVG